MNNENNAGSGLPGSSTQNANDPASFAGKSLSPQELENYVPKDQYQALEKKLGEQGEELGKLRPSQQFLDEIAPLIKILDKEPKIVEAIMGGK